MKIHSKSIFNLLASLMDHKALPTHTKRFSKVLLSLFLLTTLTLGAATPGMPVRAADDTRSRPIASENLIPVQLSMLNVDSTLNLSNGALGGALHFSGWDVALDPNRGPVFHSATLPANTWSALTDNGLSGAVSTLTVIGNDLYVGGYFSQTFGGGTTGLNNIARYNILTNNWSALTDNGLYGIPSNFSMKALAVIGNDLYVGGAFTQTYGGATTGLNNIARYNTLTNTWSALTDNGLSGTVWALAVIGNDLYVGGEFTKTFGGATTGLNKIAKYNTLTNTWSALADNGVNGFVRALTVIGNNLYVGGQDITQTFGGATPWMYGIAKYNTITNAWSALTDGGLYFVYTLAVIGNDLYVGGFFHLTVGGRTTGLNHIAKYNTLTNTWSALTDNGLDQYVQSLAATGSDLYVGGQFTQTYSGATTGLNKIARYNTLTNTWSALTDNGLNSVNALAVFGNDLYVGGYFTQTYGGATTGLNNVARYTLPDPPIFADVPLTYWANAYIERLYNSGITGGCSPTPLNYCPDSTVTRAQMAVFLLKGMHGSGFTPPAVGISSGFTDVAIDYWAATWIKQLATEGITGGCGAGIYCPDATVTRAQMAVFLLKAKHGSSYSPPSATGVFTDVPVGYWADKWIEQLASEGVTSGCGAGIYCPDAEVTRAQMAVFLVKAFNLP